MDASLIQALVSGLAVGSAHALVALRFSVTFTTTKTLNFAHGEFVSAGAFIGMSVLLLAMGLPPTATSFGGTVPGAGVQWLALLAALAVMGLVGWLLFVLGVRPFVRRPGMAWVMTTLGFGVILQSAGLAIWGPKPVVVPSPVGDDVLRLGGVGIRPQEVLMLVVALFVLIAFDVVMRRKMIGGLNNPRGCVIGGFLLGVLESFVNLWSAQWREVAVFVLVINVLAWRPNGLFGQSVVEKV